MTLDPRYRMAKASAYIDHDLRDDRHALVLELADGEPGSRQASLQAVADALASEGAIDQAHFDAPSDLRVATAWVSEAGLLTLERLVGAGAALKRFEYASLLKPPRLLPRSTLKPPAGPRDEALSAEDRARAGRSGPVRDLFVVIDHGCPFLHPLLQVRSGPRLSTRVRALWDQQPGAAGAAAAPAGFSYGTGLSRGQLETAIAASAGDEGQAYQALGYQAMRQRHSHGAHALGLLLDPRGPRRQPGPERPAGDVLFVQLPQGLMGAPSRPVLSRCLIDALVWVEARRQADERVILSLGVGSSLGPHDGSSAVEQALQTFTRWGPDVERWPPQQQAARPARNRVYVAVGNSREERLHAQAQPKPGAPRTLIWRLPPASELPATVELWLPDEADGKPARIAVELWSPDGRLVGQLAPGEERHVPDAALPMVSMVASDWAGRGCTLTLIRIAPTAAVAAGGVRAPCGDWRIRLSTTVEIKQPVHAYIGRIKPALGFPLRTSQSTFVPVRRAGHAGPRTDGTLQGLATADGVIRAGGFVGTGGKRAARYAARGPLRDGRAAGSDLDVRVDDGSVLRGRLGIGNLGGVAFRMDGTSVAAPLASRLDPRTSSDVVRPVERGGKGPSPEDPASGPVSAPRGRRLVDPRDS